LQTLSERIRLDGFARTPYLNVLTYPGLDLKAARARVRQLGKLGVEEVVFEGRTKIGRLGLVGIGTVSVVVRAVAIGRVHALKIRRTDANRKDMLEEFRLTEMANRIGVGAQAFAVTKDFMLMQLVEGKDLEEHLRSIAGVGTRARVREIIHLLLNQCRKLDLIGLDHGQLSDLRKHVIMAGDMPYIIDFESGSQNRAPKNVTTAAQYILIGGRCAPFVRKTLGLRSADAVLGALRDYKKDRSDGNYAAVLKTIGIVI
jgi:putative serine/threonine protein kinase